MTSIQMTYRLNPNLRDFWRTRKPYKLLKGGRFSSKTQDAGGMAAYLARNYSVRFLCLRQFQNRITDSVYTVVKQKIEMAGWANEFDIGVSTIRHKVTGSDFLFYGIARNIEEIKGTEGVDICWIEEGEGLTEEQWSIIDPTIRKENAEVWVLWNPDCITDFVQAKLPALLGDSCIIRHINYLENPFLSQTALDKANRLKEADIEAYNHIYLGHPRASNGTEVIRYSWLMACVDAHSKLGIEPMGEDRIGYDVADEGNDANALVVAKGGCVTMAEEWRGETDSILKGASRVHAIACRLNAVIRYDSIGVGASCGAKFGELNEAKNTSVEYHKFNAAGKVLDPDQYYDADQGIKNKDYFSNAKAQAWWHVADRMRKTYNAVTKGESINPDEIISISPDCEFADQLAIELAEPKRSYDNVGRVKVESKKDMAKRGVKSPNLADAFIMALAPVETGALDILEFL